MRRDRRRHTVGGVLVYEITIDGDGLKESVARLLCPDEDHAPPCPVPWSFDSVGRPLVVSVAVEERDAAADLADRLRAATSAPVTFTEVDPAGHEDLVEQYWTERGLRA